MAGERNTKWAKEENGELAMKDKQFWMKSWLRKQNLEWPRARKGGGMFHLLFTVRFSHSDNATSRQNGSYFSLTLISVDLVALLNWLADEFS